MKVIVMLGMPLSGKTTHAKVLQKEMDIQLYETGTFVYKEVEERGMEAIPENVKMVAGECKAKSDSYFTEKAIDYVLETSSEAKVIFISGVKALSEVNFLKEKMGEENVLLVSFHASVDTRHARLLNVDRQTASTGGKGVEDLAMSNDKSRFNIRDTKELGYGLGKLMALADFVVNTEDKKWPHNNFDTTLSNFREIIKSVLE
jgi:dephospho-CoA kinase